MRSGYQVISEVNLAFKPSFEDGMGVTVFQASIFSLTLLTQNHSKLFEVS